MTDTGAEGIQPLFYFEGAMKITDSVIKVKGIGQKSAKLYEKLDIRTVGDLLCHFPRGYERYDMPVLVSQTEDGTVRTVEGILTAAAKPVAAGSRRMIVARIRDISGEMDLRWFNSPFVLKQLPLGRKLLFRGKISQKGRSVSMVQPEIYTEEAYRARMRSLRPVYSLTAGLSHNAIAKAVSEALAVTEIPDSMPQSIRRKRGFLKLEDAYRAIHCPEDESVTKEAIKRLSYVHAALKSRNPQRAEQLSDGKAHGCRRHSCSASV